MPRAPLLSLAALRVLAVTALSFSMLAACSQTPESTDTPAPSAAEAVVEAAPPADEGEDADRVGSAATGVDGQGRSFSVTQGEAAELPAAFPRDLLVPEGLVLDTAMGVGGDAFVGGTVPGDMAALAERIDAHMTGAGWTSTMARDDAASATRLWQRGGRSASYVLERQGDARVALTISHAVDDSGAEAAADPTR
jgi:hypothetical protein